ncbi:MAG: DASH family cryptochrome [Saprospiraceae bacterium]
MEHVAIVWFRNDLRLHDNEALTQAICGADKVLPLYVFDERIFRGKTSYGFDKCGKFRTKFIIEAIEDLRNSLQKKGSDLIVRIGKPEEEVLKVAIETKSSWVYCNRERTDEEVKIQDRLEKNLWTIGQELRFVRGKMLYHTADLPFPICQVPDVFTYFRKEVETITNIRAPLETPDTIPTLDYYSDPGMIPDLRYFGKDDIELLHIENLKFKGGETKGLEQLNYYLWENNYIQNFKDTRNHLLGWDFSSKLSAWISTGCLSPKYIYQQLKMYEADIEKNESTYLLYFELLRRDFYRLMGKKYCNKIFQQGGTKGENLKLSDNLYLFEVWAEGLTGLPLIDANMRQLNLTGFISNRGRQNVASFLVNELKINWIIGAEYFESILIDYDPCSNYGNWNYIAGVGNDSRDNRNINIAAQSKKYDPNGDFVKYWIQELRVVPTNNIQNPKLVESE